MSESQYRNREGWAGEFRVRVKQEKKKWHIEVFSRNGRIHLTSAGPYAYEKQARQAAARIINCIRSMPEQSPESILSLQVHPKRKKRKKAKPTPA